MSHRLHIEHPYGQGLLAFLSQSWYCLDPRKGAKFIQMKFHGTCLVKQTDFYRSIATTVVSPTFGDKVESKDPFVETNLCACLFK